MEVGSPIEILHLPFVAAQIGPVAHMHRTMQITHQMNQELKGKSLLLLTEVTALQVGDEVFHSANHVAILVQESVFVSFVGIDVLIMPSFCVFVFRSVACIVHPIGPINDGLTIENLGNLLRSLFS